MDFPRSAGILLHPTSLPGPHGIGDLGVEAHRFVDWLVEAKQQLWQVLPLGPTGYADSPYQSFSAFAGNPMLISLDKLQKDGLLKPTELKPLADLPHDKVDFGAAIPIKSALLRLAHSRWKPNDEFQQFADEHRFWLDEFALFMALKDTHGGVGWADWPCEFRMRCPKALAAARRELSKTIDFHRFVQFAFFQQWWALKHYANQRGITIVGDIPIFVAYDSADTWANMGLFHLDEDANPTVVAGVPPDYFSATGQRWGNPLYRWEALAETGFAWWIERFRHTLRLMNVVRVDHFRGFAGYWEVPATCPTAEVGRWVEAPGFDLFHALQRSLGDLPVIAEDLGVITPDVIALRDAFGFPGMRVLQFGFAGDSDSHDLPHNYTADCVAYAGTHDNDTSLGWYQTATRTERANFLRYVGRSRCDVAAEMTRLVNASVARWGIMQMQDVLGLGAEARMNVPGTTSGNWQWRMSAEALTEAKASELASMAQAYGRSK